MYTWKTVIFVFISFLFIAGCVICKQSVVTDPDMTLEVEQ